MDKKMSEGEKGYFNGVPYYEIENQTEKKWFSFIKDKAKKLRFGNLQVNLTIKNGKVVNVKHIREEENFNING